MKKSIISFAAASVLLASATVFADTPVSPTALQGKKALFVVGKGSKGVRNDDPLIKEYLESKGVTVTMVKEAESASAASDKDLVIISSTADGRQIRDRYRNVPVPVVTWNARNFPDMKMTGNLVNQDFAVIAEKKFHNANHAAYYAYATSDNKPILKAANMKHGIFSPLTFSAGETDPSWGKPTMGADIAMTFEGSDEKAGVFSYEKGALMYDDTPAPARRVGLFLGDNTFTVLTTANGAAAQDPEAYSWFAGRRIFDAALRWAVSPPETPIKRPTMAEIAQGLKGKKVIYVCRLNMPWDDNDESDRQLIAWMRAQGINLTVVDQMEPDTRDQGQDLVIFSSSTNKYKVGNKYANTKAPMVLLEAKAVDSTFMAGRRRNTDYGVNDHKASNYFPEDYINLMRPSHPLSAGFPAGLFKLFKTPGVLAWHIAPAGAEVIGAVPNQPHSSFMSYEKGSVMANDHVAPARRVMFPMDATRFPDLTEEGRVLWGNTLLWALGLK